jgi:hypothetical protein
LRKQFGGPTIQKPCFLAGFAVLMPAPIQVLNLPVLQGSPHRRFALSALPTSQIMPGDCQFWFSRCSREPVYAIAS